MASDLAAYAGSAILIVLAQQPSRLRATLRRAAIVWLGRVSFSLYLIHVPLLLTAWHLLHRHAGAWPVALAASRSPYLRHRCSSASSSSRPGDWHEGQRRGWPGAAHEISFWSWSDIMS